MTEILVEFNLGDRHAREIYWSIKEVLTMNAIKGIYHNRVIELIEKPATHESSEVLIIFPGKGKKMTKIGGLFKNYDLDYKEIENSAHTSNS